MSEPDEDEVPELLAPGLIFVSASEYEPVCCRFCHAEYANIDFIAGHFVMCPARFRRGGLSGG